MRGIVGGGSNNEERDVQEWDILLDDESVVCCTESICGMVLNSSFSTARIKARFTGGNKLVHFLFDLPEEFPTVP